MEVYRDLQLRGVRRVFYFTLPTYSAIFSALLIYGVCVSLWRMKLGDHSQNNEIILVMCVVFLLISLLITLVFYYILKTQLRFTVIYTERTTKTNFEKILAAVRSEKWIVQEASTTSGIICITSNSIFKSTIRVTVLFNGQNVLVNSIVDPMGPSTGGIRSQARYIKIISNAVA